MEPDPLSANLIWLLHWMKVMPASSLAISRRSGESRALTPVIRKAAKNRSWTGLRKGSKRVVGSAKVRRECVKRYPWGGVSGGIARGHSISSGVMTTNSFFVQ